MSNYENSGGMIGREVNTNGDQFGNRRNFSDKNSRCDSRNASGNRKSQFAPASQRSVSPMRHEWKNNNADNNSLPVHSSNRQRYSIMNEEA